MRLPLGFAGCILFVVLTAAGISGTVNDSASARAERQEPSRDTEVTAAPVVARQTGPNEITVTWQAVPGAAGYSVGRAIWPNGYQRFRPNYPAQTRLVDRDITVGVVHRYRVVALLPSGKATRASKPAFSNAVSPTKDAATIEPTASPDTPGAAGTPVPPTRPNDPASAPKSPVKSPIKSDTDPEDAGRSSDNGRGTGGSSGGMPPRSSGRIAYVRADKEIRVILPDGTGDRRFWTHADAAERNGINELAWRPDGKELAFSSGHDSLFSRYHADLYVVGSDGKGLRKVTNTPDRAAFGRYKQGAVRVVVHNDQPSFRRSGASAGIFTVYIAGAKQPQVIVLPPRASRTLVFPSVADFGEGVMQPVVAIYGNERWVMSGTDVRAGRTVNMTDFHISGDGIDLFGAFRPVWRRDGSRLSYRSGLCIISSISANPPIGRFSSQPFFRGENPSASCAWDWGPTTETAGQVVYIAGTGDDMGIFRMTEGGAHPGVKLPVELGEYPFLQDVRWLPDGTGIVFSKVDLGAEQANLYRYDFASKKTTALTHLEDFARSFSISPDGRWIVFERTKTRRGNKTADLWLVSSDGKGLRRLLSDGYHPSWGR